MHSRLIAVLILAAVPAGAQSKEWKTEIDNSLVRVTRLAVMPHETVAVSDAAPALFVFLTECPVRISTAARQEERRGLSFWSPDGKISLENLSDRRVEVARVMPKFGPDSSYQLPRANPERVEFENGMLRMRHIGPRSPNGGAGVPAGRLQHPATSAMIGCRRFICGSRIQADEWMISSERLETSGFNPKIPSTSKASEIGRSMRYYGSN